jgi:diadenosine tetraphosphatase ApaH/serine/threonine PP2A family protein phosphatase
MPEAPTIRYAIFGDVHANLEALQAVLADAEAQGATDHVCLGDVVGYNANPHECVERVRKLACPVVRGNHDEMAAVEDDLSGYNPLAEEALKWTRGRLTAADKKWLGELKLVRQVMVDGGGEFTIVHATLDAPHKWGYVFSQLDAAASFNHQHTPLCFYGHTHSPRAYIRDTAVRTAHLEKLQLEPGKKYFINVGSVGQPRDGDWHASYCLYTPGSQLVELRRIEYDIQLAQQKIVASGLPQSLAERLHPLRMNPPADLTGASAEAFKASVGQIVSLRGQLVADEPWPRLLGATPKGVQFHLTPTPRESDEGHSMAGPLPLPPAWVSAIGHSVRVTGLLKWQATPGAKELPAGYCMVPQDTRLERLDRY